LLLEHYNIVWRGPAKWAVENGKAIWKSGLRNRKGKKVNAEGWDRRWGRRRMERQDARIEERSPR
jgi:hypothetical protein